MDDSADPPGKEKPIEEILVELANEVPRDEWPKPAVENAMAEIARLLQELALVSDGEAQKRYLHLQAERDSLAAENRRMREAIEIVHDANCTADKKAHDRLKIDACDAKVWKLWDALYCSPLTESEVARVKALLSAVRDEHEAGDYVAYGIGVHPAEWHDPSRPETNYTQRSPEMEAHNEKVMRWLKARVAVATALAALDAVGKGDK